MASFRRFKKGIVMGDITGTLNIDVSGVGGNPLPYALFSAQTVTAANADGPATEVATSTPVVDLGTVSNDFTLVVTVASPTFSPSFSVGNYVGYYQGNPTYPTVGNYTVVLQGSLDGTSWYDLPGSAATGAFTTTDGSTVVPTDEVQVEVTAANAPLARYVQAQVVLVLTGVLGGLNAEYQSPSYVITSLSASFTAYAATDL